MEGEFLCKYCGAPLDLEKATSGVVRCVYCNNAQTLPKTDVSPAALSFLRMGEHDLDTCDFDKAYTAYAKAAELDKEEPEAYFGMALATFKVQFLKDEVNERMQPICHEISDKVFTDDKNFRRALELATDEQKREYRKRGRKIDEIKEEFYDLQRKGLDYDCFLCVKVTEEDGRTRTADYDRANDIYYYLKDEGYKPFFSEREMKGRTGADYEALILYALYRSECMLIVCSDESYLKTKWVKNEYTRFLHMLANEEKERDAISFAFYGTPVEKLPSGKKVQGIDLSKPDAYSRIGNFVKVHTPEAKKKREEEKAKKQREEEARNRQFEEMQRRLDESENRRKAEEEARARQQEAEEKRRAEEEARNKELAELREKLAQMERERAATSAPAGNLTPAQLLEMMRQAEEEEKRRKEEEERKKREEEARLAAERRAREEAERKKREEEEARLAAERWARAEEERKKREEEERKKREEEARLAAERRAREEAERKKREEEERKRREEEERLAAERRAKEEEEKRFAEERRREWLRQNPWLEPGYPQCYETVFKRDYYHDPTGFLQIPRGIKRIDEYACSYCKELTGLVVSDTVTAIGKAAFRNCTGLKNELKLPDSLVEIGEEAFYDCSNITGDLQIPNSVTTIGKFAFIRCTGMTGLLKLSDSMQQVSESAFANCSGFTKLVLSKQLKRIDQCAFSGCSGLTGELVFPNGLIEIGRNAFYGCSALKRIVIPSSVKVIAPDAFKFCAASEVVIPKRFSEELRNLFGYGYSSIKFKFI